MISWESSDEELSFLAVRVLKQLVGATSGWYFHSRTTARAVEKLLHSDGRFVEWETLNGTTRLPSDTLVPLNGREYGIAVDCTRFITSPHLSRLPRHFTHLRGELEEIGNELAKAGDDPFAVRFITRRKLHFIFGVASNMDDVIRGLELHFSTLPCLRLLCDWLASPDFVFSELIYVRGHPDYSYGRSYYVINAVEAVPFCRRLFSYLFSDDEDRRKRASFLLRKFVSLDRYCLAAMEIASAHVRGFDVTAYTDEMPVLQESWGCLLRRRSSDGGMAIWFEETNDGRIDHKGDLLTHCSCQCAEYMLPLYKDSLVWLRCNNDEGVPFRLPEGHVPILAGANASGEFQYVAKDYSDWGPLFLVSEGKCIDKQGCNVYYLLLLAREPSELSGPIANDAVDPTGPLYWRQPYSCGGCPPNCDTCRRARMCRSGRRRICGFSGRPHATEL